MNKRERKRVVAVLSLSPPRSLINVKQFRCINRIIRCSLTHLWYVNNDDIIIQQNETKMHEKRETETRKEFMPKKGTNNGVWISLFSHYIRNTFFVGCFFSLSTCFGCFWVHSWISVCVFSDRYFVIPYVNTEHPYLPTKHTV